MHVTRTVLPPSIQYADGLVYAGSSRRLKALDERLGNLCYRRVDGGACHRRRDEDEPVYAQVGIAPGRVTQILYDHPHRSICLKLQSSEELKADRVVVAAGPWVHNLLGSLRIPIEVTRQYILYFAGLPTSTFGSGVFPAFMERDLYGFPIHKGSHGWLKATSHRFGPPVDPDAAVHIEGKIVERIVHELYALLPVLREAKLAHIEACMYDVSPDEDFILDYLPNDARIVFATGLSGHGFKFGPLLGHLLSSLLNGTPPDIPTRRFRLARFLHERARQTTFVC